MKERLTVSLDGNLLAWLDDRVNERTFANRSHGFEFLVFEEVIKREGTDNGNDG